MTFLYNLIILLAQASLGFISRFNPKMRLWHKGQQDWHTRLTKNFSPQPNKTYWIHAASLGEFEQGRPLIERLRVQQPDSKIILTFFSPSGYEVRKKYDVADYVCYLPLDSARNAQRFVDAVQPTHVFFIKYEYWFHYLRVLRQQQIPTYMVSGIFHPKHIFFKFYGAWFRQMLSCFTHFYVQNQTSVDLLASINLHNATITGDTRFDRVTDITNLARPIPIAQAFKGNRLLYITGSSWPADETLIAQYMHQSAATNVAYLFAPHEIDKPHIDQIIARLPANKKVVLYSQATPENVVHADVLIIDNFGLLSSLYAYGDIAHIGGGFGSGIHNTLEAATFGMPISIGPNYKRFKEAIELVELGAGVCVTDFPTFKTHLDRLLIDENHRNDLAQKAAAYVRNNCGATQRVLDTIRF